MATKNWGDVAPPDLSLQTLNAFSGDELYRYYRFDMHTKIVKHIDHFQKIFFKALSSSISYLIFL
jgi:hypothetical protein